MPGTLSKLITSFKSTTKNESIMLMKLYDTILSISDQYYIQKTSKVLIFFLETLSTTSVSQQPLPPPITFFLISFLKITGQVLQCNGCTHDVKRSAGLMNAQFRIPGNREQSECPLMFFDHVKNDEVRAYA